MRWNSRVIRETRSFLLGAFLIVFFAFRGNPLNAWWTIVIGGLLSSDAIIQAAKTASGGIQQVAKMAERKERTPDGEARE